MKRLIVSCFGLGWLPIAPGTWGSLPPTIIFALLCYFAASETSISIAMAVLALAGSIVCVKFANPSITATGKKDPGEVVADEFAGQALTFLVVTLLAKPIPANAIWVASVLGFLVFRVLDILKPWPIRRFEDLHGGVGVMADDIAAGVIGAIGLNVVRVALF